MELKIKGSDCKCKHCQTTAGYIVPVEPAFEANQSKLSPLNKGYFFICKTCGKTTFIPESEK